MRGRRRFAWPAPEGASPGLRFVWLMFEDARPDTKRARDRCRSEAFSLAIQSNMKFDLGDAKRLHEAGMFPHGIETAYTMGVEARNTSWCRSVESLIGRQPFLFDGRRLHVGASFPWRGLALKVLDLNAESLKAAHYGGGNRPKKFFVVSREELAADERARRRRGEFADLADLLAPGRPVVLWGPTAPGDDARAGAAAGVHLFRTDDEAAAAQLLRGESAWARTRCSLAAAAHATNRAGQGHAEAWTEPDGRVAWEFSEGDRPPTSGGRASTVRVTGDPAAFDENAYREVLRQVPRPERAGFVSETDVDRGRRRHALLALALRGSFFASGFRVSDREEGGGTRYDFAPTTRARRAVSVLLPGEPVGLTDEAWERCLAAFAEVDAAGAEKLRSDALAGPPRRPPGVLAALAPPPPALAEAARASGALVLELGAGLGAEAALSALSALRSRLAPGREGTEPLRAALRDFRAWEVCLRGAAREEPDLWELLGLPVRRLDGADWLGELQRHESRGVVFFIAAGQAAEADLAEARARVPGLVGVAAAPCRDRYLSLRDALSRLTDLAGRRAARPEDEGGRREAP